LVFCFGLRVEGWCCCALVVLCVGCCFAYRVLFCCGRVWGCGLWACEGVSVVFMLVGKGEGSGGGWWWWRGFWFWCGWRRCEGLFLVWGLRLGGFWGLFGECRACFWGLLVLLGGVGGRRGGGGGWGCGGGGDCVWRVGRGELSWILWGGLEGWPSQGEKREIDIQEEKSSGKIWGEISSTENGKDLQTFLASGRNLSLIST